MKFDAQILAALEQQNDYLRAILALLAREQGTPSEVVLAEFGFGPQMIAKVVDKKPDAVRMLVKRYNESKNIQNIKSNKKANNSRGAAGD